MEYTQITIETIISADIQKVWDYYTKAEHIINWNFASDDWCCPRAENDLRIGGKMNYRMEAKDGSFGFDLEGVYTDVIKHKRINYIMSDGRKVSTNFEGSEAAVKVTTTFDAETENPIEMQKDGWQAILNNFKKYVEST